jgi:DNA polymerase
MMIGEAPGDKEDLQGHPFVGPAGRVLDRAVDEVGLDRRHVYVTNAVKHFKFERSGKVRLHKKPSKSEIGACEPWLSSEIELVQPRSLLLLGATAAQTLMGASFRVSRQRGEVLETPLARFAVATVHPSAVVRSPDRELEFKRFVDDLHVLVDELDRRS